MGFLITVVLIVLVVVPVFVFTRRRIAGRLEQGGTFEVALRVVEGAEAGLSAKWRHGQVMPSMETLQFRTGGSGGARIPVGRVSAIHVIGLEIHGVRRPSLRNLWSINPALNIIGIRTPTGLLDMAAQANAIPKITKDLGFASDESS